MPTKRQYVRDRQFHIYTGPALQGLPSSGKPCPSYYRKYKDVTVQMCERQHEATTHMHLRTLRPRQNGRHFADDIFKRIFLNENFWILNKISLKYVPLGLIDNMTALVQIMACCLIGEGMLICCSDAYVRHSASMS